MESRIHGDVYVRFGGERLETYRPKGRQGALRLACGTGKTLIMCVAAYEMHRLGLARKPMIIGIKANIHEIARTFRTAYPNARLLYPGKEDFTPENRLRIFSDIKNNNWDCIILTHEQFGKIPQSAEVQRQILRQEMDDIDENLASYEKQGGHVDGWILRGLEKRKENLDAKLHELQETIDAQKDDTVDFQQMGIDHLFVDESHNFKNLMFNTRHSRVSGLGNTDGSKKAMNLLYAIRTIQQRTGRDLGATFLSGTTIANSLTELYLLFKYLRPKELERQDIPCFDAWAAVFAQKTSEFEFSVTNEVISKERFRYFIKVPELAMFYNEITDYRTAADVGIDRPELDEELCQIPMTDDQQAFLDKLVLFAKTGDPEHIGRADLSDGEVKALMLLVTMYSNKLSLDMRLISPAYADSPGNKASRSAANIAEYYRRYEDQKGTQMVFCDLSTYKPGIWNVYSEIKRKLVEDHGIPAQEIRFVQEAASDKVRQAMFDAMNEGKIRVLFGSTQKLGTGVNAQKRIVCMHHLDIPWRPMDLEQRNGRGARKGNKVAKEYAGNKVKAYVYAVLRTLDAYKLNLLHNKQQFIDQLKPRFSWGKMGNQAVSLYSYLSSVNTSGYDYSFDGTKYGGAAISALADNTITWEETTSYDAGIDFSAFGNRVLFSADWFLKRTEGILRTVNLPSQVGDLSGPKSNVGVVDNKGIELSLTLRDSWGDFSAGISGNFSYTRNEIVDLNGETEINGRLICKEGDPINSWYLLETDGVFQNQSEIDNAQAVYGNRANLRPGYVKYVNQNNDNTIDGNDRVIAGNTIPRFAYGFNLNFGWKGFAVEAQFQGVGDVSVYPSSNMAFGLYNGAGLTKQWVRDSWSATNRNTEYPLLTTYPEAGENFQNSTLWLQDASYLRLKNIQLSYTFPKQLVGRIGIKGLQVYVSGQNLVTFSDFKIWDPEISISQVNLFSYPILKTISFGINLTL